MTRRLGREALERVVQPLVAGIYAADPESLSLAATMPRFPELERQQRSLILGLRAQRLQQEPPAGTSGARWSLFVTLAGGMAELVEALGQRLPAGAIRLRSPVASLARTEAGRRWRVLLADGRALEADGVVLATPAHQTAGILAGLDAELASLLKGIPYTSSATVTLAYRREALAHPLDGFGFIVPRSEGRQVLASTFSSVKYPGRAPDGHVLLRAFLGGTLGGTASQLEDEALEQAVREEMAALLGISTAPLLTRVHRHPAALPQYRVGHLNRLAAIEARLRQHPGLTLAGNAYRGVGIANCIHSGEEAVERLLAALTPLQAGKGDA
ncbi:MAG: protoporphyrinogen oxidase [Deltaproteobacteria bacterium]|nr:protoporphyrinogen oxidase [Deltaproteobacteria bacterium]